VSKAKSRTPSPAGPGIKSKPKAKPAKKEPKPKAKKKPAALAKVRSVHIVPSRDIADDETLVRHMSTKDLASPNQRALAIIRASVQASPAEQLAYGALLCILDVDKFVVVREDDGTVWPFVQSGDRWRGAIRRRGDVVEESWFLPDEEKIVWKRLTREK
jgi:hypothetical protein